MKTNIIIFVKQCTPKHLNYNKLNNRLFGQWSFRTLNLAAPRIQEFTTNEPIDVVVSLSLSPVVFGTNWQLLSYTLLSRHTIVMCSSRKYPYSPHRRDWKFLGGMGGSQRPQNLSKCMKLDWNFQRGDVVQRKIPSVGEVWIIFGTTQWYSATACSDTVQI